MEVKREFVLYNHEVPVLYSALAFSLFSSFCEENTLPQPEEINPPELPDEKVMHSIADKITSLQQGKSEIVLQDEEVSVYYYVIDYIAKCMVSEIDEEVKKFLCEEFQQERERFDDMIENYLAFATAVIAELNKGTRKIKKMKRNR